MSKRTTDEETKCFIASFTIFAVPAIILVIYALTHGECFLTVAAILFVLFLVGGLISNELSDFAVQLLRKTDKKSEFSDWIKAYAITLALMIALAIVLSVIVWIIDFFSEFVDFLKNKEAFEYWKNLY